MKKFLILLPVVALFLLLGLPTNVESAREKPEAQKVVICHRDNNNKKPYHDKSQEVSIDSILQKKGHDSHEGPVWYLGLKKAKIDWGDIIPAFDYEVEEVIDTEFYCKKDAQLFTEKCPDGCENDKGNCKKPEVKEIKGDVKYTYPGKNLNPAGLAVWNNDCQIPELCVVTDWEIAPVVGTWSAGWKTDAEGLYKERTLTYFDYFYKTEECPVPDYYYQCDEEVAVAPAWSAWTKTEDGKTETRQTVATVDSLDSEAVCSTATETQEAGTVIGVTDKATEKKGEGEVKAAYTTAVPLAETSGNSSLAYIIQGILSLSLLSVTSLFAKTNVLSFLKRF